MTLSIWKKNGDYNYFGIIKIVFLMSPFYYVLNQIDYTSIQFISFASIQVMVIFILLFQFFCIFVITSFVYLCDLFALYYSKKAKDKPKHQIAFPVLYIPYCDNKIIYKFCVIRS